MKLEVEVQKGYSDIRFKARNEDEKTILEKTLRRNEEEKHAFENTRKTHI